MDLTTKEALALLMIKLGKRLSTIEPDVFNLLEDKGLVEFYNTNYILTKKGKDRIGNHILKEKNLPDYLNFNSFSSSFDNFFVTATASGVNALAISFMKSGKLDSVNQMTLENLHKAVVKEIVKRNNDQ